MIKNRNFRCDKRDKVHPHDARAGGVYHPCHTCHTLSISINIYIKQILTCDKKRDKTVTSVTNPASRLLRTAEYAVKARAYLCQSHAASILHAFCTPNTARSCLLRGARSAVSCTRLAATDTTVDRAGGNSGRRHHTSKARVIPSPRPAAVLGSFRPCGMGLFGGLWDVKLFNIAQLAEKVEVFVVRHQLPPVFTGISGVSAPQKAPECRKARSGTYPPAKRVSGGLWGRTFPSSDHRRQN